MGRLGRPHVSFAPPAAPMAAHGEPETLEAKECGALPGRPASCAAQLCSGGLRRPLLRRADSAARARRCSELQLRGVADAVLAVPQRLVLLAQVPESARRLKSPSRRAPLRAALARSRRPPCAAQSYWPFHRAWCRSNEFADALEATEPKFARWMRKHHKIAVLKDDEVDRLERKARAGGARPRRGAKRRGAAR